MASPSATTLGINSRVNGSTNRFLSNSATDLRGSNGMFACASRVKVPQFGDDDRSVDFTFAPPERAKTDPSIKKPSTPAVKDSYLKRISEGISFSEDVVEERCMHMTNYSDKYFQRALDASDIITPRPKAKYTLTRHNTRGSDKRHPPCNLQKRIPYKLKPLKRKILERANEMHKEALQKEAQIKRKDDDEKEEKDERETGANFFITQNREEPPKEAKKDEWDKYLMTLISDTTAQWIVAKKTEPGEHQVSTYFWSFLLGSEETTALIPATCACTSCILLGLNSI